MSVPIVFRAYAKFAGSALGSCKLIYQGRMLECKTCPSCMTLMPFVPRWRQHRAAEGGGTVTLRVRALLRLWGRVSGRVGRGRLSGKRDAKQRVVDALKVCDLQLEMETCVAPLPFSPSLPR